MPEYQYRCDKGHQYSEVRSIHEPEYLTCPQEVVDDEGVLEPCMAPAKRVFSPPTLVFIGKGWARNDK